MATVQDQENEHHRGFDYGLIQRPNFESLSGVTRLGAFTVVEDGYDRRAAHMKEIGLVQDSGAQQFHGPHPECWQSLMDVDGAAGNKNADELASAGHHTEAHAGIFADLLDFAREYWPKYSYHWRGASFLVPVRDVSENLASATSGQPWNLQPSRE